MEEMYVFWCMSSSIINGDVCCGKISRRKGQAQCITGAKRAAKDL
jgi:hypothetical protein